LSPDTRKAIRNSDGGTLNARSMLVRRTCLECCGVATLAGHSDVAGSSPTTDVTHALHLGEVQGDARTWQLFLRRQPGPSADRPLSRR
jgi:hypothetical protein